MEEQKCRENYTKIGCIIIHGFLLNLTKVYKFVFSHL